ncbi:MAG: hypothetical protein QOE40_3011, partial [Actinomycetota bacterium]|nr:hypothetical protein [Actinomycetota bacterium]
SRDVRGRHAAEPTAEDRLGPGPTWRVGVPGSDPLLLDLGQQARHLPRQLAREEAETPD